MSDWNTTRIDKSNTNLFYKEGWKVSIADVETLTQWLEVNIPFPVRVTREEKYSTNTERNPIIISAENEYNLDEFLPLIKESFGMTKAEIISENKNSFKIRIRMVLLIRDIDTILNDLISDINPCSFESIEEFKKAESIVNARFTSDNHPLSREIEKANELSWYPIGIVRKMQKGFWVSEESFREWLSEQREAYEIFCNIAY